jgi:hypothetical protein
MADADAAKKQDARARRKRLAFSWLAAVVILVISGAVLVMSGYLRAYGWNVGPSYDWPAKLRPYVYAVATVFPLPLAVVTPGVRARLRRVPPPELGEALETLAMMMARLASFLAAFAAVVSMRIFAPDTGRNALADVGLFYLPMSTMAIMWYSDNLASWWRRRASRRR